MAISPKLWEETSAIYQSIVSHPFLEELTTGTLPEEKFIRYLMQDNFYLVDFAKALAITAAKAKRRDHIRDLLSFAQNSLSDHHQHHIMMERFGVNAANAKITPITFTFSHFMISTAQNASYVESLAALLPCFWIYKELGREMKQKSSENNPYQLWIDSYADENFAKSADRAILILDEAFAEVSQRIYPHVRQTFVHSAMLEGMFWDSAYNLTDWPFKPA